MRGLEMDFNNFKNPPEKVIFFRLYDCSQEQFYKSEFVKMRKPMNSSSAGIGGF
jgi:hypothetical protein